MTKQQNFKRVIAKNGQIYYYKNGKRLSTKKGLKSFVKSIYSTEAAAVPLNFNKDERKYFNRVYTAKQNAANRYTFGFKPIPRAYALVLQKLWPNIDMSVKDISKWINPDTKKPLYPRFSDIQRAIDTASSESQKIFQFAAELGLFKEDNKQTTIIDIADLLKDKAYNTWTVIVYKMDGEEVQGRKLAMQYLSEFEQAITEAVRVSNPRTGVLARFNYSPKYDFKNKTITINLKDKERKVKLEKTLSTLPDYVQTQPNKKKKKKPEDKFPDVEIQLFYS